MPSTVAVKHTIVFTGLSLRYIELGDDDARPLEVADALGAEEEGLPRQMARMSPCCSPAARSPLPSPRGQQELDSLLADQTPG